MYKNNFAAAIKVNGKILREFGDTVYLPFGSEYQIRLKNLNSQRAKVKVQIDGETVTGNDLVMNPYKTFDLERFIRNGNLTEGNRFKFIERTSKIEQHRGIEVEDGIISIHFEFEMATLEIHKNPTPWESQPIYGPSGGRYTSRRVNLGNTQYETPTGWYDNTSASINALSGTYGVTNTSGEIHDGQAVCDSIQVNDTGITVEGSKSNQTFGTTSWAGSLGTREVLNIKLLGETEQNKAVREPVTVKTKLKCKTCGTMNSATSKFCSECGTSLQII